MYKSKVRYNIPSMIDINALKQLINVYKEKFAQISQEEIYKWAAVKKFQDNWNMAALDFKNMLLSAQAGTKMLSDSGQYFPKRMLTEFLNVESELVRRLFRDLYDETSPLLDRMEAFSEGMASICDRHLPGKIHYQDPRAIVLYLVLRYPETYFLYKFSMFVKFGELVGYPLQIKRDEKFENVLSFQSVCEIVLQQILLDNDLIKLHHSRLTKDHYADPHYRLLTPDIIYAASKGLLGTAEPDQDFKIEVVEGEFNVFNSSPTLRGRWVDHQVKAAAQKWLGDLGELVVMKYEEKKLAPKFNGDKTPEHTSKKHGDGLGYDISSFDLDGNAILIEVKTTRSPGNPFFITGNELKKSEENPENYYLYRLYNFDPVKRRGQLTIYRGSLKKFCENAVTYYVPYELIAKSNSIDIE